MMVIMWRMMKNWGGGPKGKGAKYFAPFFCSKFCALLGGGGSKKVEGAKCILRPFSRKMGAKEAQNYFAPIFRENGRKMHFAPGRRAGMLQFTFWAFPQHILLHFPNNLLQFPIKTVFFTQKNAAFSQQFTAFPQQIASFPQQFVAFPYVILCHFAKKKIYQIF